MYVTALYIIPVSKKLYLSSNESILPTADFPDAAGPSIEIDLYFVLPNTILFLWNIQTHNIKNKSRVYINLKIIN